MSAYPHASEGSREVANLTERKNPYTLVVMPKHWCQNVALYKSAIIKNVG